jgi:hypothetical protein
MADNFPRAFSHVALINNCRKSLQVDPVSAVADRRAGQRLSRADDQATHIPPDVAGSFAGSLAVFFFLSFFVTAYALSKLPMAGRMTAAPKPAIMAARNSFFTGSLHLVGGREGSATRDLGRNQEDYWGLLVFVLWKTFLPPRVGVIMLAKCSY